MSPRLPHPLVVPSSSPRQRGWTLRILILLLIGGFILFNDKQQQSNGIRASLPSVSTGITKLLSSSGKSSSVISSASSSSSSSSSCWLGVSPSSWKITPSPLETVKDHTIPCTEYGLNPRKRPAILIDGYLISDENPITVTRILETHTIVDYILMIETTKTFTGIPRNLSYPNSIQPCLTPELQTSIVHEVLEPREFTGSRPQWGRENYLRQEIATGAGKIINQIQKQQQNTYKTNPTAENQPYEDDEFLVVVSDADEVPRPYSYAVAKYCTGWREPAALDLDFYYYNFRWKKISPWTSGPRIVPWPFFRPQPEKQNEARLSPHEARNGVPVSPEPILAKGGWHMTYFMSAEKIQNKLKSFAHTELNKEPFNTIEWIEQSIDMGRDLFNRGENEHMQEQFCRESTADIPVAVKKNPVFLDMFCPAVE